MCPGRAAFAGAQEASMAKGQKKSNKEIRKPKAAKVKVESVAQTPFSRSQPAVGGGKKA
jgi:hypothetical protein